MPRTLEWPPPNPTPRPATTHEATNSRSPMIDWKRHAQNPTRSTELSRQNRDHIRRGPGHPGGGADCGSDTSGAVRKLGEGVARRGRAAGSRRSRWLAGSPLGSGPRPSSESTRHARTRSLTLDPAAAEEIEEAAIWYGEKRWSLGRRFLAEVHQTLSKIAERPHSFPTFEDGATNLELRRAQTQTFPYLAVFLVLESEIRVVALAHSRRMPGYWKPRLE